MNERPSCTRSSACRRWVWFGTKCLFTLGLLGYVLGRVDLGSLAATLDGMGWEAVLLALALTLASILVSAWRWHRVLAYLGEQVSVASLVGDTLVGTTYNLLLPTSVGGDVARSLRCARRVQGQEVAWASVMFERIMGLVGLALISMVGLTSTVSSHTRPLLWIASAMVVSLTGLLLLAPLPLGWAACSAQRLSVRLGVFFAGLARSFAGPLAGARARVETLGWSLCYQVVALSVLVAPAVGWHEPRLLEAVFLGVPIALIGAMAPVTIGGLGLRESLFVVVLEPFGVSNDRALALSLVWLGSNLTVGLLGGVVLLGGRR